MRYEVFARTQENGTSRADCKASDPLIFDTSAGEDVQHFGPAELLATSLAACLLKNLARLAPKLRVPYTSATARVSASREANLPRISRLEYELRIRTDEPAERVGHLANLLTRYSTVYNTLARACEIEGRVIADRDGTDIPTAGSDR